MPHSKLFLTTFFFNSSLGWPRVRSFRILADVWKQFWILFLVENLLNLLNREGTNSNFLFKWISTVANWRLDCTEVRIEAFKTDTLNTIITTVAWRWWLLVRFRILFLKTEQTDFAEGLTGYETWEKKESNYDLNNCKNQHTTYWDVKIHNRNRETGFGDSLQYMLNILVETLTQKLDTLLTEISTEIKYMIRIEIRHISTENQIYGWKQILGSHQHSNAI